MSDFQLEEPGVWTWGAYVIEEETDGEKVWYALYHGHGRARYFSEFATAVAAAEEDAQA
jgi:hypothetical protein